MKKFKKIISFSFKLLLRTIEVLLAFLIVGGSLLFWRLYSSPLDIREYMPTLEQYILPKESGLKLDANSVELSAAFRDEGILHLAIQNLTVIRPDGRIALRLPEVDISYDMWSLLKLNYTPDVVKIKNAFLRLTIDKNGKPTLHGDVNDIPDDQGVQNTAGVVLDEDRLPNINRVVRHILSFDEVDLQNARVRIIDLQKGQRISLPSVNMALERQPGRQHALKAEITLKIQQELTHLSVEAQISRPTRKMSFDIAFDSLNIKELGRFIPALQEADLTVEGHLKGVADLHRSCKDVVSCFKEASFQFKTLHEGTLNLPEPLTNLYNVESAIINGAISSDLNQIKIAKSLVQLKNGPSATLEVDVSGVGEYLHTKQIQVVKTTLKSVISSLPIEQVPSVWPVATGPDAHAWVKENLSKGIVEQATFTLYFTGDELTDLYGEMPVKDIQIRYLDDMSPVSGFAGVVQLWPDRVLITGQKGGISHLRLTNAEIDLTDLDVDVSHAKIKLDIQGPVREAMELIAEKPLEFPQMFGFDPTKTDGQAQINVDLAFPLIDNLGTDQVSADVQAQITDGVFPTAIGGEKLTNGLLKLNVNNQQLTLQGSGVLANLPLDIKWTESFTASQPEDVQSQYQIQGNVSSAQLKTLVPEIETYATGDIKIDSEIKVLTRNDMIANANVDLTKAHLRLYPISLDKPVGAEAKIKADITFIPDKEKGTFTIDMNGFVDTQKKQALTLIGSGSWGNGVEIKAEKVKTPNNNWKGRFALKGTEKLDIEINGDMWDLSDIYNRPSAPAPAEETEPTTWISDVSIDFGIKKLILDKEKPLNNVVMTGKKKSHIWNTLKLQAMADKPLTLKFNPKNQKLAIKTDDFGDLLWRLGLSKDIAGGKLTANAKQQKAGGFDGTIEVKDFALKDPGFLVQAFSILGIVDAITGDDLKFKEASVPFKIKNNPTLTVELEEAYMSGTSLGVTFAGVASLDKLLLNGSVIPAYAINSLPGKIPLIGALFKDGDGGGLIGARYEIKGTLGNPEVNFKPLHSIAPGILGKLFQ